MSDTAIFMIGSFVSLLLAGGLGFTVLEFRRLDKEAAAKGRRMHGLRLPHHVGRQTNNLLPHLARLN